MEIKSIQPTAKFKADLANGQPIELEIAFVAMDEVADYVKPGDKTRLSKVMRKLLIGAVTGWDLTSNEQPIPCDDANKEKYLNIILGLQMKPEEGEKRGAVLGLALLNFAADSENFLKN